MGTVRETAALTEGVTLSGVREDRDRAGIALRRSPATGTEGANGALPSISQVKGRISGLHSITVPVFVRS